MTRRLAGAMAIALIVASLTGCRLGAARLGETTWLPRCDIAAEGPPGARNGSTFDPDSDAVNLLRDSATYRACDLLTVTIREQAKGGHEGATKGERESSSEFSLGAALGLVHQLGRDNPNMLLDPGMEEKIGISGGSATSWDGSGSTMIEGSLDADLTVVVVDVLDNDLLEVEGGREIIINNELQVLWLHGYVDPDHVRTDDRIDSYRLANATIALLGQGAIADKQAAPWMQRVVDQVWPM